MPVQRSLLSPVARVPPIPQARIMHRFLFDIFGKEKSGRRSVDVSFTQATSYISSEFGEPPSSSYRFEPHAIQGSSTFLTRSSTIGVRFFSSLPLEVLMNCAGFFHIG